MTEKHQSTDQGKGGEHPPQNGEDIERVPRVPTEHPTE